MLIKIKKKKKSYNILHSMRSRSKTNSCIDKPRRRVNKTMDERYASLENRTENSGRKVV